MNSHVSTAEQLLARVIAYLEGLGMVITQSLSVRALELVQEALQQQEDDPYVYAMTRLPQQFALPQLDLPQLAPAINRGSIGYHK